MHATQHFLDRCNTRQLPKEAIRAALLFGKRFSQPDHTVLHLVTRKAAVEIAETLGLTTGYVHAHLYRAYVVATRDGACDSKS